MSELVVSPLDTSDGTDELSVTTLEVLRLRIADSCKNSV